ncbi:gliding motility-associated C-terminal domain-containing protein [Larkinella terrae]|uniref:T9SS type B sorting domain-containing protein n=1 Tax=Larkinella terrae TaxID=2025311 RepID=A0A7K0ELG3_9BACT|nr:gliding motility-associated C-terminal domain-containing protein [Larkinella terrae]MRS62667.1 T9SS type B sorting domain-containing protein [Larkinella terrae]
MKQFYRIIAWCSWLVWCWMGLSLTATATHIVGGELELKRLTNQSPYTHQISLNLYFDDLNGNPQAEDPTVGIFVYRKGDNAFIGSIELPQVGSKIVDYTKPECALPSLRTRLLRYSSLVVFNMTAFNDPRGYYMVWERCCRNNSINNIQNPGLAGSTFYLEFPAQRLANGQDYLNSSPTFRPVQGDYICINQPFSFDFGATDPDNDSLVYRLVTPYNGFSTSQNPRPQVAQPSSAYPEIRWINGLNQDRAIPGPAPLKVNARTGLLTVTAGQIGLFVFCVQVEEYRKNASGVWQKIGLVRRDFQLKVIDCQKNNPPSLAMRQQGQVNFYKEGTVMKLSEKDAGCVDIYLTDLDPNQRIKLSVLDGPAQGISFAPAEVLIPKPGDTLRSKVCFDKCLGDGQPLKLALLATDEGCPQGLKDTLYITIQMEADLNRKPDAETTLPGNQTTVQAGKSLQFNVLGKDPDQDMITLTAVGRGFNLAQVGMSFSAVSGQGSVSQQFNWSPQCDQVKNTEYIVDFIVTDTRCNRNLRDTVTVRLKAAPATGHPPTVRTTLNNPVIELTITHTDSVPAAVRFDVIAEDPDPEIQKLTAVGNKFDWTRLGMKFENKTGPSPLVSPFVWQPGCDVLQGKEKATYELDFISQDNSCPNQYDTTRVTFVVKDIPVDYNITITNVITPNGDGKNDIFSVPNLPQDNCVDQFRRVDIHNRWGKAVFSSTDRLFRWDGADYPTGQYYYLIQYTNRSYKGTVSLLR